MLKPVLFGNIIALGDSCEGSLTIRSIQGRRIPEQGPDGSIFPHNVDFCRFPSDTVQSGL